MAGDPYCPQHGHIPCRCYGFPFLKDINGIYYYTNGEYRYMKYQDFTMSDRADELNQLVNSFRATLKKSSSDSPSQITKSESGQHILVGRPRPLVSGYGFCSSGAKKSGSNAQPKSEDKLAEQLRKTAETNLKDRIIEAKSAYIFFLERSKLAAQQGKFSATFWISKLPWTREEIEVAANMLRDDNFHVTVSVAYDLEDHDVEIQVDWGGQHEKEETSSSLL